MTSIPSPRQGSPQIADQCSRHDERQRAAKNDTPFRRTVLNGFKVNPADQPDDFVAHFEAHALAQYAGHDGGLRHFRRFNGLCHPSPFPRSLHAIDAVPFDVRVSLGVGRLSRRFGVGPFYRPGAHIGAIGLKSNASHRSPCKFGDVTECSQLACLLGQGHRPDACEPNQGMRASCTQIQSFRSPQ